MIAPVAITCGDPSGIGLEVTLKAWKALQDAVPFFLIADPKHLPADAAISLIADPGEAAAALPKGVPVLPHNFAADAIPGKPTPANAIGVVEVIKRAVRLTLDGAASAICTAPISKKELVDHAGFTHPGHTEYLGALTGADRAVMMIASDMLRVVPTTIHIPLAEVPQALTPELLEDTIRITHAALIRDFGLATPRIAVSGLNPHAGENGMLGAEDDAVIEPVCVRLRAEGMALTGPLPADTMFHAQARASYDAAVLMYHDQALVPVKTLAFDTGVNVTLGLPIIRTSPDHGTAFGIAGKGVASPTSMIEALRLAYAMAEARAA
ncbi:MAG: 4-hydroxythreonine-4-phosphate dehydrogenase PdxA [Pseudomonadota bacterium]